ncbi:hypothetical protein [Nonomuraea sp. NPDC050786]|uniref:hypothetical protein n=1 Tax=Nonomuraea sp. NPDC050786 TaxID=3154840 RepID=UPI0033D9E092
MPACSPPALPLTVRPGGIRYPNGQRPPLPALAWHRHMDLPDPRTVLAAAASVLRAPIGAMLEPLSHAMAERGVAGGQ